MRRAIALMFLFAATSGGAAVCAASAMAHGETTDSSWDIKLMSAPSQAGQVDPLRFQLRLGDSKSAVRKFEQSHERLLHAWLVRDTAAGGFTDFQHVHPVLLTDGTWELQDASLPSGGTWNLVVDATSLGVQRYGASTFDVVGTSTSVQQPRSEFSASVGDVRVSDTWSATVRLTDPAGKPVGRVEQHIGAFAHWPMFMRSSDGSVHVVHGHASGPISKRGELSFELDALSGVRPAQLMDGWLEFRPENGAVQMIPVALGARTYSPTNGPFNSVFELLRQALPRPVVDVGAAASSAPSNAGSGGHHG